MASLGRQPWERYRERAEGHELVGISRTRDQIGVPVTGTFGDCDQPDSLSAAYEGLDRLLIIPTTDMAPGAERQSLAAIDAAVAVGVGRVVIVSSTGTRAVAEPHVYASYFAAEQRLMRTASRRSILRMNYYAEAIIEEAKMSLAHGVLTGLAENRVAFVSRDDLAKAAAGLLAGDHHDGAIYNGTGPASLGGAERAAGIAKAAGQPMSFVVVTEEALRSGLEGGVARRCRGRGEQHPTGVRRRRL